MPAKQRAVVSAEQHRLRLAQIVAPGTPGAYVDKVMGFSWLTSSRGLNGKGGFVQVDEKPTLLDQSDFDVMLPPVGSDGVQQTDRFYFLAGTPDVLNPSGPRRAYFAGDEVLEVYRGRSELRLSGTPISLDNQLEQLQITCRDVLHWLKKSRETAGGFWCHHPRDALEHYTRMWLPVIDDDFADTSQFPGAPGSSGTTPNGRWSYFAASNAAGASYVQLGGYNESPTPYVQSTATWTDSGMGDHSAWRVECTITVAQFAAQGPKFGLQVTNVTDGNPYAQLVIDPYAGVQANTTTSGTPTAWPLITNNVVGPTGQLAPPYTLAIEARDRWLLFYVNGQLIGNAPRPTVSANRHLAVAAIATSLGSTDLITVDNIVARRTSIALNGGQPGDYVLPSPPTAGGLTGVYYDLAGLISTACWNAYLLAAGPANIVATGDRLDPGLAAFVTTSKPAWQYGDMPGPFFVRWTGAIELPLHTEDAAFQLPSSPAMVSGEMIRVWVGKTRAGEQILTNWIGDTPVSSLASMRAFLYPNGVPANADGTYPIVIEYAGSGQNTGSNPAFEYSLGGGPFTIPGPSVLCPEGCFISQVNGGSHYDQLKAIADQFGYQWKGQPRQLEDPYFPGIIVPQARVGRDTDKVMDSFDAIDPHLLLTAEDQAQTLAAAASGLGGVNTGSLTMEAFDFEEMLRHPFISTESENLPQVSDPSMLALLLDTLLALRGSPWEDFQASNIGDREMRDTFPLTGQLAEFDWQPGDGLLVELPQLGLVDVTPRQIFSLQRTLYPDGVGASQATFRARPRNVYLTLRKMALQIVAAQRNYQGQLMPLPGTRAIAPAYTEALLPEDLSTVIAAELYILSKDDSTTTFQVEVNGTVQTGAGVVTTTGLVNLGQFIARNNGVEPRMIVRLVNPSAACNVSYMLMLTIVVPQA